MALTSQNRPEPLQNTWDPNAEPLGEFYVGRTSADVNRRVEEVRAMQEAFFKFEEAHQWAKERFDHLIDLHAQEREAQAEQLRLEQDALETIRQEIERQEAELRANGWDDDVHFADLQATQDMLQAMYDQKRQELEAAQEDLAQKTELLEFLLHNEADINALGAQIGQNELTAATAQFQALMQAAPSAAIAAQFKNDLHDIFADQSDILSALEEHEHLELHTPEKNLDEQAAEIHRMRRFLDEHPEGIQLSALMEAAEEHDFELEAMVKLAEIDGVAIIAFDATTQNPVALAYDQVREQIALDASQILVSYKSFAQEIDPTEEYASTPVPGIVDGLTQKGLTLSDPKQPEKDRETELQTFAQKAEIKEPDPHIPRGPNGPGMA